MQLVVDSARFKFLLICLLGQPLANVGAGEPAEDVSHNSVQLITVNATNATPVQGRTQTGEKNGVGGKGDAVVGQQHPLEPLLALAHDAAARIATEIEDYTCTMVKRERVDGRLLPVETIFAKVRHAAPRNEADEQSGGVKGDVDAVSQEGRETCLYLRFESPRNLSGREILFPCPGSDDQLLVRNGGLRLAFVTLQLTPTCPLAMHGNRYPITEFGIERLVHRMIRLGEQDLAHPECEVKIEEGANVDSRACQCIEVIHPVKREHFVYHLARIYIDKELQLPIRFEAYDWPSDVGGEPELIEDYTYRNLRLNVGLTSDDFSRDNPGYQFRRR